MGNLNINTTTNTIEAGTAGGGIQLEPGAADVVKIGNGVLLPDGTKAEPAIRFSDDNNTGIYSPVNDTLAVTGNGEDILQLTGVASGANYLKLTNSSTGNPLLLAAEGSDANIGVNIDPKGTGAVSISGLSYPTSDGTNGQLLQTDGSGNLSFTTVTSGDPDQNLFATVSGDTGTTSADSTTDTLTIAGGTDITTSVSGDTVTIDFTGSAGGGGATGYLYTDTPATAPSGTGSGTLAIGDNARAFTANNSILIGNGATSEGNNQLVIGNNAAGSSSFQSIIIGDNATASSSGPISIGAAANARATSIALGESANAVPNSDSSIAIGNSSSASGRFSLAVGTATSNTPGFFCEASGLSSVALGNRAQATNLSSVALGNIARSFADDSIAIGKQTNAQVQNAICIGDNAITGTNGTGTIIIGTGNGNMDFGDIVVGNNNNGTRGFMFGTGNTAAGLSLAMGSNCDASAGFRSVAIGRAATAPNGGMQIGWGSGPSGTLTGESDGQISAGGSNAQFVMPSYTVATLPTGTTGGMIFVTDEVGGSIPAFFDGTDWRRVTDRAVVS